jgi:hypothetical protein
VEQDEARILVKTHADGIAHRIAPGAALTAADLVWVRKRLARISDLLKIVEAEQK